MGAKRFLSITDYVRFGMNLHVECGRAQCEHYGIVDPYQAGQWFRLHRWPPAFEAGALNHFRCTKCGHRAGRAFPTEQAVTVLNFFPADERGWQAALRRLRG